MLPLLVLFLLMALCLSDCLTLSFWSKKKTLIVNFAIFGVEILSFSIVARVLSSRRLSLQHLLLPGLAFIDGIATRKTLC